MRTRYSFLATKWRYRNSNAGRPTGGAPLLLLPRRPRGPVDVGLWLGDWDCRHCGRAFWGSEADERFRPPLPIGLRVVDCLTEAEEEAFWDGRVTNLDRDAAIDVCPYCRATGDECDPTVGPRDADKMGRVRWGLVGRRLAARRVGR